MENKKVSYLPVESENTDYQNIYMDLKEQCVITAKFDWKKKGHFKITHALIYKKENNYHPQAIEIKEISNKHETEYHTKIVFDFKNIPAPTNPNGSLKNPKESRFTKKTGGSSKLEPKHVIDLARNPKYKIEEKALKEMVQFRQEVAIAKENSKVKLASIFNDHICRLYII
ncbi:hypothetical protein ATE84_4466 [Aquimarina sp. MAR_2010_214]|uniref:hypothetical protein n=1 Tax=Aquimarina sp. MAR_2010_214 TaxID=1250026 RepID=UPI000C709F48|nr:hypothetical protein [Aquimarina sp. MAR_2010_214]PKV52354.1 hypothetical protein ATE84_4466 [Aquimarina sp. MAR_2010_214]